MSAPKKRTPPAILPFRETQRKRRARPRKPGETLDPIVVECAAVLQTLMRLQPSYVQGILALCRDQAEKLKGGAR